MVCWDCRRSLNKEVVRLLEAVSSLGRCGGTSWIVIVVGCGVVEVDEDDVDDDDEDEDGMGGGPNIVFLLMVRLVAVES